MADTQFKDLTPAAAIEDDDELLVAKAAADDPAEFRRVPGTSVLRPSNLVAATVDFGTSETESARVTVAAPWVTTTSIILCTAAGTSTADHSDEDAAIEGVTAIATNFVDGVGFDIVASAPRGTWGRYVIHALGA